MKFNIFAMINLIGDFNGYFYTLLAKMYVRAIYCALESNRVRENE
jgi:hypothetical protein